MQSYPINTKGTDKNLDDSQDDNVKVRKAIITNPNEENCVRFLQITLWDSEISPEVAFLIYPMQTRVV